jgi:2-amino-4-hydroxy-6-hydroxymethyldihydropteridine diphosphokinase
MTEVYVAAGSNVAPFVNLPKALRELRKRYPGMRLSPAYRNQAVGFVGEDFVNLVVGFSTDDGVHQVIAHLHEAEAVCGRPRDAPKWAPRTMDLDLLLYGDLQYTEPGLKVPRPDLLKRPYMLRPMAELAPECRHPVLGQTLRELWQAFDNGDRSHDMELVTLDL